MNKTVRNLLIGVAALVGTKMYAHFSSPKEQEWSMAQRLDAVAAMMNKSYPKTGPLGVRIDKVTHGDGALLFNKTLTEHTVDELDPAALERNRPAVQAEFCNSGSRTLIDEGVTVGNRYFDKNGAFVVEYLVRPADCQ